jgi:hypothetical protein
MAVSRINRVAILLSIISFIFLLAVWQEKDELQSDPLHFMKRYFTLAPSISPFQTTSLTHQTVQHRPPTLFL